MDLNEVKAQWAEWMEQLNDYFSNLNEQEKYGWIGEGTGLVLVIVGLILL